MWWHTRSNSNSNIPQTLYSWSDPELEDWSTSFLKRPEAFPMSPSPDLLVAPSNVSLVAGPYLYGYRSHPAPTPVTFEPISSPALSSVSSTYLDPHTVNGYLNERNQPPTPTVTCATLSSTNDYDPQCPSPWADVTSSPVPSSVYPNQTTIKRPFDENTPSSSSIQENGAALTPTSHYDDRLCGPWFNMTPSSVPIEESHCTSEATNEPSQSKLPCRSRRRAVKKQQSKDYGTYKCEYKDCTYDRMFSRKGVLVRHIQTQHINPRGFKCPFPLCEHASSRRENLKAHRQSVHKEIL